MDAHVFRPADILIPYGVKMEDWSVIACDQFTSEPQYWDRVKERVGDAPSTLNMILPEAYLGRRQAAEAAEDTASAMEDYLDSGVLWPLPESYVYVERETASGLRRGVVGMIDLECYDYTAGSSAPVRASERTVAERLPARVAIRERAKLEVPHTIVLIDDPERRVIEPLGGKKDAFPKLYDFDLMEGGGRIRGWAVTGETALELEAAFRSLQKRELAFVIGDGNHSMAAAKEFWNSIKETLKPEEREKHPARFFLCEAENVYDSGVDFLPIHRVVFDTEPDKLLEAIREKLDVPGGREIVAVVNGENAGVIRARGDTFGRMVDIFQEELEEYAYAAGGEVDFIHGDDNLRALTREEGSIGFLMPVMDKSELFSTVLSDGRFPKKSFSIGLARDKRYYLECRRIAK